MANPFSKFVWFDYVGKDAQKAQAFYGELFNWKTQDVPNPAGGSYTMIVTGGEQIGGYMGQPPGAPAQAHWLAHLSVQDAAATIVKIKQHGGKVRKEPQKMGDMGTMAIVADPFDATFALWQPAKPEAGGGSGDFKGKVGTWCWNEL